MSKIKMFLYNILIAIDQLINVFMLGDPDETISSRAGRVWPDSTWTQFIDFIMFWQTNHCYNAIEECEGNRDVLFPRVK
jgi:hypothetical protein